MKELLKALGLAEGASEEQALAALKALTEASTAQIAALSAKTPDPAKWVPLETHSQTQNALAALTAQVEQNERDLLVETALSDGRILPAQEAYWRAQPVTAMKAYLEVAQPVAALGGTQTGGNKPEGRSANLSDADVAVMKALGLSAETFVSGKLNQEN